MSAALDRTTDTPRVDEIADRHDGHMDANEANGQYNDLLDLARQLERELEICRDAHMANCLAADTLRTEIRALREELFQSKAPVIGECEDCGHKIVTPLGRLP